MNKKDLPKVSGVALAIAAAGLIGTAQVQAGGPAAGASTVEIGHCYDVNRCKGHNDCKTAENACAGQASCEGHGFVGMPLKSCADVGGEIRDEWRGEVAQADLIRCYAKNICKGHNDCKTLENDCAGKATRKGHGFLYMPAKACRDIGGAGGRGRG